MNKVILMGRLTRDPELQQTPQGTPVCRFSIAVNRRFAREGQQQADFINCTAWRQQAEFVSKWFPKGSMIAFCHPVRPMNVTEDFRQLQSYYPLETIC